MKSITQIDWEKIYELISRKGYAILPNMFTKEECEQFINAYQNEALYRNAISMERYRFGKGEYKYFQYPLPTLLQHVRETFYASLVPLANAWMDQLSSAICYPDKHEQLLAVCYQQKQIRPTSLVLHYTQGGFNTLHQDLYGDVYFPFQVVFLLSQQGIDFEGGELVLTEHVPRAQQKVEVINFHQGDAAIITTNFRPVKGVRGFYKAKIKHGVSEVRNGERYALGVIFHDAV